eukprot:767186-Hanusia_phi.AAC.4
MTSDAAKADGTRARVGHCHGSVARVSGDLNDAGRVVERRVSSGVLRRGQYHREEDQEAKERLGEEEAKIP